MLCPHAVATSQPGRGGDPTVTGRRPGGLARGWHSVRGRLSGVRHSLRVGLAGGAAVGSDQSYATSGSQQRRYDNAFTQCMYAKGHRVPVAGRYSDVRGSGANQQ